MKAVALAGVFAGVFSGALMDAAVILAGAPGQAVAAQVNVPTGEVALGTVRIPLT